MTKPKLFSLITLAGTLIIVGSWSYLNLVREANGKSYWAWHSLREEAFEQLRRELRPLTEVAKGAHFNAQEVAEQAIKVHTVAQQLPALFEAEAPSGGATSEIWEVGSEFSNLMSAFLAKTESLSATPPADAGALRAAIDELQLACADCHRNFRD